MKFFLLLVTLAFCANLSYGQYCPTNTNSTDPDIVNNDNDPNNDVWDWRNKNEYNVNIKNSSTTKIISPFFVNALTGSSNPNVIELSEAFPENIDYQPKDGWELLYKDFGLKVASGRKHPFFALYNKYEGKLRYFFYMEDQDPGQISYLSLFFDESSEYVNASLEHIFTPMDPIENYTDKGINVSTTNKYLKNGQLWVMADVPIAYDPCTCQNSSKYHFGNMVANVSNFHLKLEGGGELEQIFDSGSGASKSASKFNIDNITKLIDAGNRSYKSSLASINDLEKNLVNFINSDFVIKQRLKDQGGIYEDVTIDQLKDWQKGKKLPAGNMLGDALIWGLTNKKFFPKQVLPKWISEVVPYAGYITPIIDFFVGGGKPKPTPMKFGLKLSFEGNGKIINEQQQDHSTMYVPGSKNQYQEGLKPVYNNVLGVLNLVESPVLLKAKEIVSFSETTLDYGGSVWDTHTDAGYVGSYKLKKPIVFALNPDAGLKLKEIVGSFKGGVVKNFNETIEECEDNWGECYTTWDGPNGLPNVENIVIGKGGYNGAPSNYSTAYLPLDCLFDYSFGNPKNTFLGKDPVLHVIAKLQPANDPNAKEVIFSATYNVEFESAPYSYKNTPANPYADIPWNTTTDDINKVLNGEVVAWNKITVTSSFEHTNKTQKLFEYGKSVTVVHTSNNPNEASWSEQVYLGVPKFGTILNPPIQVVNRPACSSVSKSVGAVYLASFCSDVSRYNPVAAAPVLEDEFTESSDSDIDIRVYPNPMSDVLRIEYPVLNDNSELSISIVDLLGQPIMQLVSNYQFPKGVQKMSFPISDLSKGVYIVVIQYNDKKDIIKVVKL